MAPTWRWKKEISIGRSSMEFAFLLFCLFIASASSSVETSFVISHRIALTFPTPKDEITDEGKTPTNFTFEVSFGRWPVIVEDAMFFVPIKLDGKEVFLEVPHHSQDDYNTIIHNFCERNQLSGDNCAWLSDRIGDLYRQTSMLGGDDELMLSNLEFCLSLTHSTNPHKSVKKCLSGKPKVSFLFTNHLSSGIYNLSLIGQMKTTPSFSDETVVEMENKPQTFMDLLPGFSEVEFPATITVSSTRCTNMPFIEQPLHGSLLGTLVELKIIENSSSCSASRNSGLLCLSLDEMEQGCHIWPPINETTPYLRSLLPGRHKLEVWWKEQPQTDGTIIDKKNHKAIPAEDIDCKTSSEFEVSLEATRSSAFKVHSFQNEVNPQSLSHTSQNLVFVTGASQRYFDEGILQNLVGSIHFWEPLADIEVFDFGLDVSAHTEIAKWKRVKLMSMPKGKLPNGSYLPKHFFVRGFGAYAAKPWVTLHALERATSDCSLLHTLELTVNNPRANEDKDNFSFEQLFKCGASVLWIDANTELRRPLSGSNLVDTLKSKGGFFVTHPYGFPTPQFHHLSTLESLGCPAQHVLQGSLPHCATTFMGFTTSTFQGMAVVKQVLEPLVACGLNESCVFPAGSSRANHRQEQTALNAILCNISYHIDNHEKSQWTKFVHNISSFSLCSQEDRYKLTSDFENRHNQLQPTTDPTDWNDMVFYTRRRHPNKPYTSFLKYK